MKKLVVSVLVAVAAMACSQAVAGGVTYHWKGTEVVHNFPQTPYVNVDCAFWTNAANWVEGVVPGEYKDADGNMVGTPDATVIFGALPDGGLSMVNIQGVHTVSNLIIASDAPSYSIGVSLDESKERFGTYTWSGRIIVEAGAPAQTFKSIGMASDSHKGSSDWMSTDWKYPVVINNSSYPLTIGHFGTLCYDGATWGSGEFPFGFAGTGDVTINAFGTRVHTLRMMLHQESGAKMTFAGGMPADWVRLITSKAANRTIEFVVPEGKSFNLNSSWGALAVSGAGSVLKFTGAGDLRLTGGLKKNNGTLISPPNVVSATVQVDIPTVGANDSAGFYVYEGSGTVRFNALNTAKGYSDICSTSAATFSGDVIGYQGSDGNFGGKIRASNSGRLLYTGPGETTDREIVITNYTWGICNGADIIVPAAFVLEQGGTGKLTVESPLHACSDKAEGATLILANSTAEEAEWKSVLADTDNGGVTTKLNVTKRGTGVWTLSGVNTYTGATTIEDGTLEIAAGGSIAASSGLVTAGTAKLAVADGETVEVQAITQKTEGSGALDVVCGEGASLKCAALPAGPAPSWLTVNGMAAEVKSDGTLAPNVTAWKAATSGAWSVTGNWDNGLPSTAKSAFIDEAGDYTVTVEEAAGTVGSVTLTGGNLAIAADMAVQDGVLSVGAGTTLSHTDGTLALDTSVSGQTVLRMEGGTANLSGGTITLGGSSGIGGSGTVNLSGTHAITSANHIQVAADAGKTLEVASTGTGVRSFSAGGEKAFRLGGVAGGVTKLSTKRSPDSGYIQYGYSLDVGYRAGLAELTVAGSQYAYFQGGGNGGASIGTGPAVDAQIAPTGVVKVIGGYFTPGGLGFWWTGNWGGLCVGNGVTVKDGYGSRVTGILEQSAGICTPSGTFGIGIGRADGRVMQTGGTFTYSGSSTWNSLPTRYHPMVVGYAGGDGSYVISNGTATVKNGAIFVGGCLSEDLGRHTPLSTTYVQSGKADSVGLLAARGGSFTHTYASGIIVGADGTGRLEVGPAGTLTTPYLAISNNVSGTLAFELGADGRAGTLVATNLTIAAGAKLVVDARGAKRLRTWTKLASLENAPVGAFAAGDVTVFVNDTYAERFANPEVFYERNGEKGVFLKGEDIGLTLIVR